LPSTPGARRAGVSEACIPSTPVAAPAAARRRPGARAVIPRGRCPGRSSADPGAHAGLTCNRPGSSTGACPGSCPTGAGISARVRPCLPPADRPCRLRWPAPRAARGRRQKPPPARSGEQEPAAILGKFPRRAPTQPRPWTVQPPGPVGPVPRTPIGSLFPTTSIRGTAGRFSSSAALAPASVGTGGAGSKPLHAAACAGEPPVAGGLGGPPGAGDERSRAQRHEKTWPKRRTTRARHR